MIKDYYYLLGLPRGAPLSDIKLAYRRLAAQYHPDKVAGMSPDVQQEATAKMMELNEAIAIFTDPERRAEYDQAVELIPERKPKPPRPAKPATHPGQAPAPEAARQPAREKAAVPSPAPPPQPRVEPPPPTPAPVPAASPEPNSPPRGMLAEEYVRKLKTVLKKLPLKWYEANLRGWQWALAGGGWRRSILVAHRHLETLSLLSFRTLQAGLEALLQERQRALRPTVVVALVSYDRLMDAKPVQQQLQAVVADERGWLKNVRILVVLYDGQRAALFGRPSEDPEVQRLVRVLLGR